MHCIGIIPARMGSSRFPGKPLKNILGMPMLGHVYFRSKMSALMDEVYIATCDQEIMDYAALIGAKVVMTKDTHERATDRTAEAMEKIEAAERVRVDIVVMIQGDEPMVTPEMIDASVRPLVEDETVLVSNLMASLGGAIEHDDKNEVKVVVDKDNNALYFSREAIPSRWKLGEKVPMWKQVCIIPFRRGFLLKFNALPPTPLEISESVDMLRVLEHGYKVKMAPAPAGITYSVDTPEDLTDVEEAMKTDLLIVKYKQKNTNKKNEPATNQGAG